MANVKDIAKVVIQKSSGPISNLKLQKLLYYVQGWSLAVYGRLAFHEDIQAWVHGPVVPTAFFEYRHNGWNNIPVPTDNVLLSDEEISHIEAVLSVHGRYSAAQLERASHKERPWLDARGNLDPKSPSNAVITPQAMTEYFTARMNA